MNITESNLNKFLRGLVVGSGMAAVDATLSQPLENWQQRAQAAATNPLYKRERISFNLLTRGTLTSATFAIPITAIQVGANNFFNSALAIDNEKNRKLSAALLAGLVSSPFVTFRDCLVTNKSVNNTSPWALITTQPTNLLFRALPAVSLREAGWSLGYLALPCILRQYRLCSGIPENGTTDVGCSVLSGAITAFATQPADVVRSALQNDINGEFYKNSRDALKKIYRSKGLTGLFAGLPQRSLLITFSVVVLDWAKRSIENNLFKFGTKF